MILLEPREPMSAWSHALGCVLAVAVTRVFWRQSFRRLTDPDLVSLGGGSNDFGYERGKAAGMLIFGASLIFCYGASTVYHAAAVAGEPLNRLRRLDHVGIYLLIAGTYTPAAWSLLKGGWRTGTLAAVWTAACVCSLRVWLGGTLPVWLSTLIYLSMGWGVIFCYRELVRDLGHRKLSPLPLGGAFYSVGAVINLLGRPALVPGFFEAHDLFHLFVIAGSACHVLFMVRTVVPALPPIGWAGEEQGPERERERVPGREPGLVPSPHFSVRLRPAGRWRTDSRRAD